MGVTGMRRMLVLLGLVGASFAIAPNAFGACVGTQNTVVVCATTSGTLYEDCVYTGIKPGCSNVSVPGPIITCGGSLISCR
jgi:hypothetical protein